MNLCQVRTYCLSVTRPDIYNLDRSIGERAEDFFLRNIMHIRRQSSNHLLGAFVECNREDVSLAEDAIANYLLLG
jgi:hypothetical protein